MEPKFKAGDKGKIIDAQGLENLEVPSPENGDYISIFKDGEIRNDDGEIVELVRFLIDGKDTESDILWAGHGHMFEKLEGDKETGGTE